MAQQPARQEGGQGHEHPAVADVLAAAAELRGCALDLPEGRQHAHAGIGRCHAQRRRGILAAALALAHWRRRARRFLFRGPCSG